MRLDTTKIKVLMEDTILCAFQKKRMCHLQYVFWFQIAIYDVGCVERFKS
jgi:hypothetical protein